MLYITIRPGLIFRWLKIRLSRGQFSAAAQSSHASTSADSITNTRGWVNRKGHGFDVAQSTVSNYLRQSLRPRGQTWKTFIENHKDAMAVIDLFVVPGESL